MRRKMTAIIIAGTMLAITGATLPASATVVNTDGQYLKVARNHPQQVIEQLNTTQVEGMTGVYAYGRNRPKVGSKPR